MADGTVFAFKDPDAINRTDLMAADPSKPLETLSLILVDEEYAAFSFSTRDDIDCYFLEAVLERYLDHHNLATTV
jgi:hypothetical protein